MKCKHFCAPLFSVLLFGPLATGQAKASFTATAAVTAPTNGDHFIYTYAPPPFPFGAPPMVTGTSTHRATYTNTGTAAVNTDVDTSYTLYHATSDGGMTYSRILWVLGGEENAVIPPMGTLDKDGDTPATVTASFKVGTWATHAETEIRITGASHSTLTSDVVWTVTYI